MEDILVTSEDLWRDISVWTASLYGFLTLMSLFRSSLLVDDRPLVGERDLRLQMRPTLAERMDEKTIVTTENTLISEELAEVVELCYWMLKFVSDVEAEEALGNVPESVKALAKNTKLIIKLSRFVVKFIKSFEKLVD